MEAKRLELRRLSISNYKSVRKMELIVQNNLTILMGRNNAGKSNILDSLLFLADAHRSLEYAVSTRGGDLLAVLHKKREENLIEVVFEFSPSEQLRLEIIQGLFARNPTLHPETVASTPFLQTITLRISVGINRFSEELCVSGLRPNSPTLPLFQTRGSPGRVESTATHLESMCEKVVEDFEVEKMVLKPGDTQGTFRLPLGLPDATGACSASVLIAELVQVPLAGLQTIDPVRNIASRTQIQGQSDLAPDAANLADVLHWVYNNRPKQFRRIESEVSRLVPQLGRLYTPTFQNDTTLGMIENEDEDLTFTLDQMSFGTKSAIAIITKVILAKPGAWLCVEEPEINLHPQAQVQLFQFLRAESIDKRILVATHSTPIAAATPLESLFIVERDSENCTTVVPVTSGIAGQVIDQLAVQPTINPLADAVVLLEESDAIPVFETWARRFGLTCQLQFLEAEDGQTLRYFANMRIALSKQVHMLVYLVLNSPSSKDAARELAHCHLLQHLNLEQEKVLRLEEGPIENYLLQATTFRRAFPEIPVPDSDLDARLQQVRKSPDRRKAMRDLLQAWKLGPLDDRQLARLAGATDPIPEPVATLFADIESRVKPYLSI